MNLSEKNDGKKSDNINVTQTKIKKPLNKTEGKLSYSNNISVELTCDDWSDVKKS